MEDDETSTGAAGNQLSDKNGMSDKKVRRYCKKSWKKPIFKVPVKVIIYQ